MRKAIRILVVDDHPVVRAGISKILSIEPSFQIVGEADTGGKALDMAVKFNPDVILLDLNLPDIAGVEVCKALVKKHPAIKVIVLTIFDDDNHVLDCIKAGASGYLLKDIGADTLIDAIKSTCVWGSYIHPSVAGKLITDYGKLNARVSEQGACLLTTREIEVLARVAEGRTNKEIAEELYISEKTVKNHITNVFKKLKVSDRTEAVVQAMKKCII